MEIKNENGINVTIQDKNVTTLHDEDKLKQVIIKNNDMASVYDVEVRQGKGSSHTEQIGSVETIINEPVVK